MKTRWFFLIIASLSLLVLACGRKAAPVWLEPEKLPPPHSISAVFRPGEVIIKWQYPQELAGYVATFVVQRGRDGTFADYARLREMVFRDTMFSDAGPGGYSYRVGAVGRRKGAGLKYSAAVSAPPSNALEAPGGLKASATSKGVRLEWQRGPQNRGFNVYRMFEDGGYEGPLNVSPLEEASFTDTRFFALGKDTSYVVRAMRYGSGAGNMATAEGAASAPLKVDDEMFRPSSPSGVEIASSGGRVLIYWKDNPEAWIKGYSLYRARNGGGFVQMDQSRTPAYTDSPEKAGEYSYRVHAVGPTGLESKASQVVRVSLPSGTVIK